MIRRSLSAAAAACLMLLSVQPAFGHGLLMKLRGDGNRLVGELYYSNGSRAGGEWVEVTDHGKSAAPNTFQTDPDGRFSTTGEPGHRYSIRAIGEEGHEIEMEITLQPDAKGQMIERAAETGETAEEESPYPAWALIGGGLLLSVIPALWLRRRGPAG